MGIVVGHQREALNALSCVVRLATSAPRMTSLSGAHLRFINVPCRVFVTMDSPNGGGVGTAQDEVRRERSLGGENPKMRIPNAVP